MQAVSLLKDYIDNNFNSKKVILLGDLNDIYTDQSSNNVFQALIDDNINYLLTDLEIAQSNNLNWSYPTWPSHLDHIIITNEIFNDFQNYNSLIQVIKVDSFMNSWNNYEQNVTDHRPVGLKLNFSNLTPIIENNNNFKKKSKIDIMGRNIKNLNSSGLIFNIDESGDVEKYIYY